MINRSIPEEQLLTEIADVPIDFLPKFTEMVRTTKRELLISATGGKYSESQLKKFKDSRRSWSDPDIEDIYRKYQAFS